MDSIMAHEPALTESETAAGRIDEQVNAAARPAGEIWLDGNVILCACPDCRAPMSVRLWLMMADCWQCGASVELSEAQERQVEQLLAERQPAASPAVPIPPPHLPPPAPEPQPVLVPDTPGASLLPADAQAALSREPWSHHLLNEIPAWLISMLAH